MNYNHCLGLHRSGVSVVKLYETSTYLTEERAVYVLVTNGLSKLDKCADYSAMLSKCKLSHVIVCVQRANLLTQDILEDRIRNALLDIYNYDGEFTLVRTFSEAFNPRCEKSESRLKELIHYHINPYPAA